MCKKIESSIDGGLFCLKGACVYTAIRIDGQIVLRHFEHDYAISVSVFETLEELEEEMRRVDKLTHWKKCAQWQ